MIYVIATMTVHPEKRADFLENARTVIAATHREDGCIHYDLHSSITEPNTFVFVERWTTRDALEAHFGASHVAEWRRVCAECVDTRKVEVIHPDRIEEL